MTPALPPEVFRTSRSLDAFNAEGLERILGYARYDWPLAIMKELADNAIDAAEDAGTEPEVTITIADDGIEVADSGPGIAPETVAGISDLSCRTSSRASYVGPTRGRIGNAVSAILAIPYILSGDERRGLVDIASRGIRHEIEVRADPVAQEVHVRRKEVPDETVKSGASMKIYLPEETGSEIWDDFDRFLSLARSFALFNPHLRISIDDQLIGISSPWSRWTSRDGTSPLWYRPEDLGRLISAHVSNKKDMLIRDFIATFAGLSSSPKRAEVLNAAGLQRARLSDLVSDGGVGINDVRRLLAEMKSAVRPIKPKALGVIGGKFFAARFISDGMIWEERNTFEYRKAMGITKEDLPWVAEVAFAERNTRDKDTYIQRILYVGLNGSPVINGGEALCLSELLSEQCCESTQPVILAISLMIPRPALLDMGKTSIDLPEEISSALRAMIQKVTKRWAKTRRREDRKERAEERAEKEDNRMERQKDIFDEVADEYYNLASDNWKNRPTCRGLYYIFQDEIARRSGKRLKHSTFSKWVREAMREKDWRVEFGGRGEMVLPHGQGTHRLGTKGAEEALAGPGPRNRFAGIFYCEKETILSTVETSGILDKYDLVFAATQGITNISLRMIIDRWCAEDRKDSVPIYVLHDFDPDGFKVLNALTADSEDFTFKNRVRVVELGLRLCQVRALDLPVENVMPDRKKRKRTFLRETYEGYGVSDKEFEFLTETASDGSRKVVHLDALMKRGVDAFIAWLEERLVAGGAAKRKVIPDRDAAVDLFRNLRFRRLFEERTRKIEKECRKEAERAKIPSGLTTSAIRRKLKEDPLKFWKEVVAEVEARGAGEEVQS